MITIENDQDLLEAVRFISSKKKPPHVLHLFLISLNALEQKSVLHGITDMLLNLTLEDTKNDSSNVIHMVDGGEWQGSCLYDDGTSYELVLYITKVDGMSVEGKIKWTSLNGAVTKFLGLLKKDIFKFREYEVT